MSGLIRLTGRLFNLGPKLWLADQSLLCNSKTSRHIFVMLLCLFVMFFLLCPTVLVICVVCNFVLSLAV